MQVIVAREGIRVLLEVFDTFHLDRRVVQIELGPTHVGGKSKGLEGC